jgi:hypothetical protein
MSTESREPSEEELRAAYEAELKQLRVEHVLLDHVAALANLGMRRTGLAPGTETERDPGQVRLAIESLRALLPVLEQAAPSQVPAIRDAVSQLQMAYVRIAPDAGAADPGAAPQAGGTEPPAPGPPAPGGAEPSAPGGAESPAPGGAEPPSQEPPKPGEPGPAQRSGRLWVPGQ